MASTSDKGAAQAALDVRQVRKSFAGVEVLKGVDLVVRPSSVHALIGHNGSGKSTLIKALAGFHSPDEHVTGTAFGTPFTLGDHASAARAGLRFVHQDLGLVEPLSIVDNIALGTGYPLRRTGIIGWRAAYRRSRAAMESLGYDVDVTVPVVHLSAAERTGVAIARALQSWSGEPSVVVLDEPTASMPAAEAQRLFKAIDHLRRQGLGIVFVSHHLDEILAVADDVTVLRNGDAVLRRQVAGLTHEDLITAVVGRELAGLMTAPLHDAEATGGKVLTVDGLRTPGVHGVSFSVSAGEIVGIAGIVGSGRDSVLPAIAGAVAREGTVTVQSSIVPANRPRAAIRAGLGFVPANRRRAAVLPTFDSASNLTVSGLGQYLHRGLLNRRAEAADANAWFERLDIAPRKPKAPILTLSGGNQQKVMVGRWLRRQPALLALDEPTQGVDVGAQQAIYQFLHQAAEAENGVLISSSDGDELAAICHRVLVFVKGRIAAELTGAEVEAERIDALSLDVRETVTP